MISFLQNLSRVLSAFATPVVAAATLVGFFFPETFIWVHGNVQTVILGIIMLTMGLTLSGSDFAFVAKRPFDFFIGAAAQFVIMPGLAWLLVRVFRLEPALAIGIMLVGCCPGGVSSNIMCYLCRGDVAFSVGMTCVSTLLAPVMTPLLMEHLAGTIIKIDFWGMFRNILIVTVVPVSFGVLLNFLLSRKKYFSVLQSLMPGTSVICLALIVGGVIAAVHGHLIKGGWPLFLLAFAVAFCHNAAGYLLGWFAGTACRFSQAKKRTLAIEVGMQNAGLGTVLATVFFAGTHPLAVLPCAISCVWHSISGTIVASIFRFYDHLRERK